MPPGLGPVVGNRFDRTGPAALTPHLQQRLAGKVMRTTPEGTFNTRPDGRMEFVPDEAVMHERAAQAVRAHNALVLQRIHAIPVQPMQPELTPHMGYSDALDANLQRLHTPSRAADEGDNERRAIGLSLFNPALLALEFMPAPISRSAALECAWACRRQS